MEMITNPTHLNTLGLTMDILGFLVLFLFDELDWNGKHGTKSYWGLSLIVIGFALQIVSNYMPWSS